jgi:acetoacetate decarboxylase
MKKEDVVRQYATPIGAPAFVQGPHRFKRREYLNITYRTDREALAKLVPATILARFSDQLSQQGKHYREPAA